MILYLPYARPYTTGSYPAVGVPAACHFNGTVSDFSGLSVVISEKT
jgi:hypothetical protein